MSKGGIRAAEQRPTVQAAQHKDRSDGPWRLGEANIESKGENNLPGF